MIEHNSPSAVTSDGDGDSGFVSGAETRSNDSQSPDIVEKPSKSFSIKDILGEELTAESTESTAMFEERGSIKRSEYLTEESIAQEATKTCQDEKDLESTARDHCLKKRASPNQATGVEIPNDDSLKGSDEHDTGESHPKKKRRARTTYTTTQLDALEQLFHQEQYPDLVVREEIAKTLDLDEERVQIWFQNRRAKYKRTQKEGRVLWMRSHLFGVGLHPNYPQGSMFASTPSSKLPLMMPPMMPSNRFPANGFFQSRLAGYLAEMQGTKRELPVSARPTMFPLPPLRIPVPSMWHFRHSDEQLYSETTPSIS
ncbi:ALX homeobox protein 1-like [Ptychodera flava]|uniref:ALX homeobox protein 1-like n=1 Tax=Ptychodera flava TaxID=63121 RepID=UPI00396A491F